MVTLCAKAAIAERAPTSNAAEAHPASWGSIRPPWSREGSAKLPLWLWPIQSQALVMRMLPAQHQTGTQCGTKEAGLLLEHWALRMGGS